MSREIKFRIWSTKENKWMFGYEYPNLGGFSLVGETVLLGEFGRYELDRYFNDFAIMQFTGLKDKNGKEIYEGDQLSICAGYSSTVEFQDGMFVSVYKHSEDGEVIPLFDAIGKDTIIVGNIFQAVC